MGENRLKNCLALGSACSVSRGREGFLEVSIPFLRWQSLLPGWVPLPGDHSERSAGMHSPKSLRLLGPKPSLGTTSTVLHQERCRFQLHFISQIQASPSQDEQGLHPPPDFSRFYITLLAWESFYRQQCCTGAWRASTGLAHIAHQARQHQVLCEGG